MTLQVFPKRNSGFTLLELLIVIAIIAILISIGLASYTRVQKNARDSQRKADLRNVAGALENFYADFNQYPSAGTGANAGRISDTRCNPVIPVWGTNGFICTPPGGMQRTYMAQLPKNPVGDAYFYSSTGQSYCLAVNLETVGAGSLTCGGNNYNFRLTQTD